MIDRQVERSPLVVTLIFAVCMAFFLIGIVVPINAQAELVPTGDSPFYYKMGGGQSVSIPAYDGAQSIPLNVEASIGSGYNCGLFNPLLSITNSLNGIQNSFQNLQQSIVNNATAAITQFPLYAVARADPDLYNLINNGLLGAREDLNISTKSCQQMQTEIAKGQNPYSDWLNVSMGNDWKYRMSLANASASLKAASSNEGNADINQVKQQIEKDNGDNGVPWVHGANSDRNGTYAGGRNQPAIYVIHDTVIAGYNVILQAHRNYDDTHSPLKTDANQHLIDTWSNPVLAANWITNVLGDEKITTFAGGDKASSPGVGILADNQAVATRVLQNLQNLVSAQQTLSIENLKAVSAPGVMVNIAVINAIRQKPAVLQAILINKLSQEVATSKVIDKALLAKQILEEGSQIPAIYGNRPAQETIKNAILRLDQAMNNLLFNVKVRKELVSNTAAQLLSTTQVQQLNSTAIQGSSTQPPMMDQGAVKANNNP